MLTRILRRTSGSLAASRRSGASVHAPTPTVKAGASFVWPPVSPLSPQPLLPRGKKGSARPRRIAVLLIYPYDGETDIVTKLTVLLPAELSRPAKARAALEGTTLSAVVRQHLEEFAAGLDVLEEADDIRVVREIETRLERGEEPVHDWEDVKAELDAIAG